MILGQPTKLQMLSSYVRGLGGLSLCLWGKREEFGELYAGGGIC